MGSNNIGSISYRDNVILRNYDKIKRIVASYDINENDKDDLMQLIIERVICEVDQSIIDQTDLRFLQTKINMIISTSFVEYYVGYNKYLSDYFTIKDEQKAR